MATITPKLASYQQDDGTHSIVIRVSAMISGRAVHRHKPVGFAVLPNQFREGNKDWVYKHQDAIAINAVIADMCSEMVNKMANLKLQKRKFDFDYILSDIPAGGHTLGEILDIIANEKDADDEMNQCYRHLSLKRQVIDCLGGDICLNDIGRNHVKRIVTYFKKGDKAKGWKPNKPNTARRKKGFLRTAFHTAQVEWPKEIIPVNPFELVRVKGEKTRTPTLDKSLIADMEQLQLSGFTELANDMFLFSYFTHGMRFENVATLRKEAVKGELIKYRMNKGRDLRDIEVHERLLRIINKYIDGNTSSPYLFPALKREYTTKRSLRYALDSINVMVNTCLKRVSILLGISFMLSFKVARTSFAYMLKKGGVDPHIIKDSLGHELLATTDVYLHGLDDDHLNEAITPQYYK